MSASSAAYLHRLSIAKSLGGLSKLVLILLGSGYVIAAADREKAKLASVFGFGPKSSAPQAPPPVLEIGPATIFHADGSATFDLPPLPAPTRHESALATAQIAAAATVLAKAQAAYAYAVRGKQAADVSAARRQLEQATSALISATKGAP